MSASTLRAALGAMSLLHARVNTVQEGKEILGRRLSASAGVMRARVDCRDSVALNAKVGAQPPRRQRAAGMSDSGHDRVESGQKSDPHEALPLPVLVVSTTIPRVLAH